MLRRRAAIFGLLLLLPALALAPRPASAASFDCEKAKAPDEQTICADRRLNDLDVQMALLFELDQHLIPMGGRDALRRDHEAWLKSRQACRRDAACLRQHYDAEVTRLRAVIDQRVITHGPF